jgi:hypothetical protein
MNNMIKLITAANRRGDDDCLLGVTLEDGRWCYAHTYDGLIWSSAPGGDSSIYATVLDELVRLWCDDDAFNAAASPWAQQTRQRLSERAAAAR